MARYGPAKTQEEVDEALEEWHELYPDDEEEPTIDLFDYLGWSLVEYKRWLETGKIPDYEED